MMETIKNIGFAYLIVGITGLLGFLTYLILNYLTAKFNKIVWIWGFEKKLTDKERHYIITLLQKYK